jgi:NitT/TauT family transport system substrate-binding protein
MRRLAMRRLACLILIAALASLVGCDRGSAGGGSDASQASAPLAEVRLGYFANLTHAQAVLGVASGDFQKALGAIQLQTKVFNAGPELIQALNAGAVDIGYVGPGPVLAAYANSHGESVRVLSGAAANGVVIVARQGSGIHSLRDLQGRQILTPQLGNTQDVSARHYVTAILGQSDSANVKGVPNSQQAGLFARGTVDAAWVPEPWGARLVDQTGAELIGEEKDLWPDHEFALTVIITTPEFLAAHPEVVEKILEVHHSWTVRLDADPERYAEQLNGALSDLSKSKPLPATVVREALGRIRFTDDPLPATFATMGQWSADLGFTKQAPNLTGLFETGIISKLAGASPAATRP